MLQSPERIASGCGSAVLSDRAPPRRFTPDGRWLFRPLVLLPLGTVSAISTGQLERDSIAQTNSPMCADMTIS
jgi:hypothetical protein